MKRKYLEQRARDYSIGVTHYRRKLRSSIDLKNYVELKKISRYDFLSGAKFRIESVWHGVNIKPKIGEPLLLRSKDNNFGLLLDSKYFNVCVINLNIVEWAYIKDLTPTLEE